MIDLRSDTVTRPSADMRRAMYEAEVGDDVYGEDPTVARLQEEIARILSKEQALFVPSGVMSNQLAIKSQTSPGDEVIVDRLSHIYNHESGAAAALAGVQLNIIPGDQGIPTAHQVETAIRAGHYWEPATKLVTLENTVNKAGGVIVPLEISDQIGQAVSERGIRYHLDGARLWNASVASGIPESRFAAPFDTVSVCLSKGLGSPVGSCIAGDADTITRAHRYRKMFGGGMRQAGVLAAAALFALEHNRDRLADDHENAQTLAQCLNDLPGFEVDLLTVQTNIVIFHVSQPAERVVQDVRSDGILMSAVGSHHIRAVTHLDVSSRDIETVARRLRSRYLTSIHI